VPPLTAAAGVLLLSEALSMRLVLASAAILGGIALVLFSRTLATRPRH
jgi:drug/metabolite transporter (DMT)-like permease